MGARVNALAPLAPALDPAALFDLPRPAGECRFPMGPTPDGLERHALEVWNHLHA